jgi:hypothetical protein
MGAGIPVSSLATLERSAAPLSTPVGVKTSTCGIVSPGAAATSVDVPGSIGKTRPYRRADGGRTGARDVGSGGHRRAHATMPA